MPKQEEHDRPENLVESPNWKGDSARSLEDAANSHNSLQGYAAMNDLEHTEPDSEVLEEEAETEPPKK